MSGQLQDPAALLFGSNSLTPIKQEAWLPVVSVCELREREKLFAVARIRAPDRPLYQLSYNGHLERYIPALLSCMWPF